MATLTVVGGSQQKVRMRGLLAEDNPISQLITERVLERLSPFETPRQFFLRHIENEIDASFLFAADARNAYMRSQLIAGDAALTKLAASLREAIAYISLLQVSHRSLTHRLEELRESFDRLLRSRASSEKSKVI